MYNKILGLLILGFLTVVVSAQAPDIEVPDEVTNIFYDATPRGIFVMTKLGGIDVENPETWRQPCVDGVTVRVYWKYLNPGHDFYRWKLLDDIFVQANANSKKVQLTVIPGFESPQWVFEDLKESEKTLKFRKPRGSGKGTFQPLPIPWSDDYLNMWLVFVNKLADRYGKEPALSLISITGPNSHNGEVYLPSKNNFKKKNGDDKYPNYKPLELWKDMVSPNWRTEPNGAANAEKLLKDNLLAAYEKTIKGFQKAFEPYNKYFALQIFNQSLPVPRKGGLPTDIQKEYQRDLIEMGRDILCKHFVLMNGGLTAWPMIDIISTRYKPPKEPLMWKRTQRQFDKGFVTGLLQKDRVDPGDIEPGVKSEKQIFRHMLRNGIRFGASFVVIFEEEVYRREFRNLIAGASILLGGGCVCQ